jgi:hypothetical protein
MRRILFAALTFMAAGLISSADAVQITGIVQDTTDTATHLVGATVTLRTTGGGGQTIKTTTTGAGGVFSFDTALSAGTFALRVVMAPTYAAKTVNVTVTAGSTVINQNIQMARVQYATVTGTVTDSVTSTTNLDSVRITLTVGGFGGATIKRDTTGTAGTYQLDSVPYGTYTLTAARAGYFTKSVDVTVNAATQTVDIPLVKILYSTISGTVTDSLTSTKLLDSVRVSTGAGAAARRDTTGADGVYQLANMAYGYYTLTVTRAGYVTKTVDVTANAATQTLDIQLVPLVYATVTGTVTDTTNPATKLDSVRIALTRGGLVSKRDTTGADGVYTLDSVTNGAAWTITATRRGYATRTVSVTVTAAGAQTVDITLVPLQVSRIVGVISDSSLGTHLSGAIVTLRQGATILRRDTTGVDGAYVLDSVVTGDYTIRVQDSNYVTKSVTITTRGTADQTVSVQIVAAPSMRAAGIKRLAGTSPDFTVAGRTLLLSNFADAGMVRVYSLNGGLVWHQAFGARTAIIAFPAISGNYIVTVTQKNAVYRKQIALP